MILSYSPAFDAHHTALRILSVLWQQNGAITVEAVKILQFYLAFPTCLAGFQGTQQLRSAEIKKALLQIRRPYAHLPSQKVLFRRSEPVADLAVRWIAGKGMVDIEKLKGGDIAISRDRVQSNLIELVDEYGTNLSEIYTFITERVAAIPTYGPRGIKALSGLMEYRYDNV